MVVRRLSVALYFRVRYLIRHHALRRGERVTIRRVSFILYVRRRVLHYPSTTSTCRRAPGRGRTASSDRRLRLVLWVLSCRYCFIFCLFALLPLVGGVDGYSLYQRLNLLYRALARISNKRNNVTL